MILSIPQMKRDAHLAEAEAAERAADILRQSRYVFVGPPAALEDAVADLLKIARRQREMAKLVPLPY